MPAAKQVLLNGLSSSGNPKATVSRKPPICAATNDWKRRHLAYAVDNIYDTCKAFIAQGVTINRPPRDGRMAFIRTPDGISIELLQAGEALPPAEPWTSMANTGSW